jgi:hypothetical protein
MTAMSQRTQFFFTGAHVLPAVMLAANGEAAGAAVLSYLALLGMALLSAVADEPARVPVRIKAEEERDIRRRR